MRVKLVGLGGGIHHDPTDVLFLEGNRKDVLGGRAETRGGMKELLTTEEARCN